MRPSPTPLRADTAAEHDLLEAARRSPLAELREQCARTKAAAHVDLEARRRRIHQRRSLRSYTDPEGEWHLHCRNNPEVGARIMAALDPIREEIFRRARSEARHEPPDAYAADALAEMARQSCGTADAADDRRARRDRRGRRRRRCRPTPRPSRPPSPTGPGRQDGPAAEPARPGVAGAPVAEPTGPTGRTCAPAGAAGSVGERRRRKATRRSTGVAR